MVVENNIPRTNLVICTQVEPAAVHSSESDDRCHSLHFGRPALKCSVTAVFSVLHVRRDVINSRTLAMHRCATVDNDARTSSPPRLSLFRYRFVCS